MNPNPGTRPDWVSDELFPFTSRFADVDGHSVHYIDEGTGPTLLLLHGNPTWSFLYRDMVRDLREDFRCIAVDHPGFGLSEAAPGYGFRADEHSRVLTRLVQELDLADVTVMVQDWGGPIGIGALLADRERYRRLIVGNTWMWPMPRTDLFIRGFSGFLGGPGGRLLIQRTNLFVEVFVPRLHAKRRLTKEEMDHYRGPFPTPASRTPTSVFPRQIMAAAPFLTSLAARESELADLDALIVWADKDPAFKQPVKRRWQRVLPKARTVDIHGAGHFLQDDAPEDVVAAIRTWWTDLEGAE